MQEIVLEISLHGVDLGQLCEKQTEVLEHDSVFCAIVERDE
jgi:hypothetical protein